MDFKDKLKLLRKTNNMTQAEFAASIGISRGNLANLERGSVKPTAMLINCISLMYHVDKDWLLDDSNEDLGMLKGNSNILSLIIEKYKMLDNRHKKFVEHQIDELLNMQNNKHEI